jgi:hypothetical protein
MKRALLALLALFALGCEPTRSITLELPDGVNPDEVVLEVAVYVAATPNITCTALELGIINAAQILPTRVLVADANETSRIGAVPRAERRLVVGNAFRAEDSALVAKGCVEMAPRENGDVVLPLLKTVAASLAVDVTVVARIEDEGVVYELYDRDLELTEDQNIILDLENALAPGEFIDAPIRMTVTRSGALVKEAVLDSTAGRIGADELGIEDPGFYRVELRPRWSPAPLVFDVGAFVIERLDVPALDDTLGAELTTAGGVPTVITRAGNTVTFSPLDGSAPVPVTVDGALIYLGQLPERGAVFTLNRPALQLDDIIFAPSDGGPLQTLPGVGNGVYQYPVMQTAGCPGGEDRFVVVRNTANLITPAFLDSVDLSAASITPPPAGGLPIGLGPSACGLEGDGEETRVGIALINALGLLLPTLASGERFESGAVFADVLLTTPTTLSTQMTLGRAGDGLILLATPDFEGISVSAYLVDLEAQLMLRQREPFIVPLPPAAMSGGQLEDVPFDVALSHLGGTQARLDIGLDGARAIVPFRCDEPPIAPAAAPPCQLIVGDVDDDGTDEIVALGNIGGAVSIDVISLDR